MIGTFLAQGEATLYDLEAVTTSDPTFGVSMFMLVFWLPIVLLAIIGLWKVFVKAGQPGWACLIPIYNIYILLKIAGRPGWWLLLMLIPFVNLVVQIIVSVDVAKKFGKSELFGVVGLFFFSFIGYLMLGFGDAKYNGKPAVKPPETPAAA